MRTDARRLNESISTVEIHLSGRWLSGSSKYSDRLGSWGKFVENFTNLPWKLPVFGSSTVQCYGFSKFHSGVIEMFGRRYTRVNKNPSALNFLSPKPEVTCGTVAIIIRVVLLSLFAHSCRFSVLHSLQSITPRVC